MMRTTLSVIGEGVKGHTLVIVFTYTKHVTPQKDCGKKQIEKKVYASGADCPKHARLCLFM